MAKLAGNKYSARWAELEATRPPPEHLRNTEVVDYEEFANNIMTQDDTFVEMITESLYSGDFYVAKDTFPGDWLEGLKERTIRFAKENESTYHPMTEGCPDFQRIIDLESTKLYSYTAVRRSSFFFSWNSDPVRCFEEVNKRWRTFKFLSGNAPDAYESNTPKDGVVDRIQVALYPSGGGGLASHADSTKNQKVIIGAMMSRRGDDYQAGGFYVAGAAGEKVDFEHNLDVGDMLVGYPTVTHGVFAVDPHLPLEWGKFNGRWFLGLYSNDSNHVKNRSTTKRLPESGAEIAIA